MSKKINVGLIGYGNGGRNFHAPIIHGVEELNLYAIVTSNEEKAKVAQKKYHGLKIYHTAETLLEDPQVELVVITIPNTYHAKMVEKALLAGKHVVVDKPFTIYSKEADSLIQLAKEKGKILTVYQNRRWDSDFLTIQKILQGNFLGNLVEYEAHFDRFKNIISENSWKEEELPGNGIIYDLGPHLIDQALLLFGIPQEVRADIRIQRKNSKIHDYFEIILDYENLKVSLYAGMLVKELGPHFILKGDKGSYIKYGMDPQEELLKKGNSPLEKEDWGEEKEEEWGILNTEWNGISFRGKVKSERGDYRIFYKNVARAIMGLEKIFVKPQEARNVIKLIELAIKSNEEKRAIQICQKDF
ncbi:oxidoreductase [Garciella nitratireducens]|uniref:oxidoreductase n=1 Tax=Garciella nitratireducens TaxID=218205 RepID=UPI001BD477C2|nr:oxidoreductase [Garciella nitratireducens]